MKTENVIKASDSFDCFISELRAAPADAIEAENQFAELVIFNLLEDLVKTGHKVARVKGAATA